MNKAGSIAHLATGVLFVATFAAHAQIVTVDDGLVSGFQDLHLGHHNRGRGLIGADFNLDGRIDFFLANPGDQSFVILNTEGPAGEAIFELGPMLLDREIAWGGAAADYDQDGDYDLYVSVGANEDIGYDYLFRNLWMENGQTTLSFDDVTDLAGIRGPRVRGGGIPVPVASANGVWADYDQDGDPDLFVSVNILSHSFEKLKGRNVLWRNNGDGSFEDVTESSGLSVTRRPTRNSTFFDFDNDGDMDLYESNHKDLNVLWRNNLVETGTAVFEDVSNAYSSAPGEDIRFPLQAFASVAADMNNDGWEDLVVFMRKTFVNETDSPYEDGHALFLNQNGRGFVNVAHVSGLNSPYESFNGVMGCQVGDLNGDGLPDVFIGNGAPMSGPFNPDGGQFNQFFTTSGLVGDVPRFLNRSGSIDFPAPENGEVIYPPYPYRTHGTNFVDVDNDGILEIAVSNGGPSSSPDSVREPNRLFRFEGIDYNWLKIRPVGDAQTVSLDAIGTKMRLRIRTGTNAPRDIYRTLYAGAAFPAQNGFEVHFGLGDADIIDELWLRWPDGSEQTISSGLNINTSIVVNKN